MNLEENNKITAELGKLDPVSSERPINNPKHESSLCSNDLINEYFVSPRKFAENNEEYIFSGSANFVKEADSDGISNFGTHRRVSLSKFSKRFIKSPTTAIRKRKNNIIASLAHLSLQDLIFRQKLQQFVRYLRNHSGVNNNSTLNRQKLRIINDKGAFENEILKYNSLRGSHNSTLRYYEKQRKTSIEKRVKAEIEKVSRKLLNIMLLCSKSFYSALDEKLPVLKPFGKFIVFWELLMLFMTSWNLVTFSLIFCFKITNQEGFSLSMSFLNSASAFSGFEILCLILYHIDMILKFNTSFYSHGEAVSDRRIIFKSYFKGGLIFDLLGSLPFWLYLIGIDMEGSILLFFLLFKIYPLQVFFKNINEALLNIEGKLESAYQLIKLLLTVLIVCHIFACMWHYQALEGGYPENNWISKQGLINHHWWERYLRSLYFTVVTMTTVGYGDISPSNTLEYVVAMTCMFIGSGLIGYSVNSIGAILKKRNKSDLEFRNKMQLINGYLKKNNVHERLKVRVRKYLEYIWKIENSEKEKQCEEILKELPNSLREELLIHSRLWTVQSLFSRLFGEATVRRILNALVHVQFSKEEWIFQEGEKSENNLFIVAKGTVSLLLNQGRASKRKFIEIDSKKSGDHFDLFSFVIDTPKPYSAKATSVSSVFKLGRKEFMEIVKENPEDYERFCMIRDKCFLNRELSSFGQRCKSCGEPNHLLLNCPYLCFRPFKTIVVRKHLHSKTQKRIKYKRKNKLYSNSTVGKCNSLSGYQETRSSLKDFQDSNPDLIKDLEEIYTSYQESLAQFPRLNRAFSATIDERMADPKDPVQKDEFNVNHNHDEINKKPELKSLKEIETSTESFDSENILQQKKKSVLNSNNTLSIFLTDNSKNEIHKELIEHMQNNKENKSNLPLSRRASNTGLKSGGEELDHLQPHGHGEEFITLHHKPYKRMISHQKSNIHSIDFEHVDEEDLFSSKPKKSPLNNAHVIVKPHKSAISETMFSTDMDKGHNFPIYLPNNNKIEVINSLNNKVAFLKLRTFK